MVKLDKIGFIATLVGGLIGIVFGILNLIGVTLFQSGWFGGPGLLGIFLTGVIWPIIAILASAIALLIGLKAFLDILDFDLIIWAIIIIILGVLVFGIGGYVIILGGILVLVAHFVSE